ncbi:penicillin acylase family protein [Streptomyces aureus]|uniref:Penicillin acylase family protein n=1 Tax=Streptomyces aureus TaxID=193461 RepID=A0ABV4SY51_9ACTN
MKSAMFTVEGVSGPVEIVIDRAGVPHISAPNSCDVFFGQGFTVARDRLFQLDWWRRRGLGLTAQVLGSNYIERDRAARLFTYRGDMEEEWTAYGPGVRETASAFTAGINAWIELTERDPALLAPEFDLLGFRPARWAAGDVVRVRSHGLYGNVEQELARALTLRDFGPQAEDLRRVRAPEVEVDVPDGLDLDVLDERVLDVYRLATGPVSVVPKREDRGVDGSNNWVVAGERTATGRPLLANDPHRAMTLPSLRYMVHLTGPDFDVIGAGEPALPGVSIGHNGHIAFGLTNWPTDQEDLYVYELHPQDTRLYRYRGEWELMQNHREMVPVANSDPVEVELLFTRHGPVIRVDEARRVAFAIRAVWLMPGMAPYLGSLRYLSAKDVDVHREALDHWGTPGSNHVYAGLDGRIGWTARSVVPVRPNWTGLLPVPGDGRYEWAGFVAAADLPDVLGPQQGWVGSANEMNLPPDRPKHLAPVSYEWLAPFRMQRIAEILDQDAAVSVTSSARLQNDYLSLPARTVCRVLATVSFDDEEAERGRQLLTSWDHRMTADSAPAALFEHWFRWHLRPSLYTEALEACVPAGRVQQALRAVLPAEIVTGDAQIDLALLSRLESDPAKLRGVLRDTLRIAVRTLTERFRTADTTCWSWGELHTSRLDHPLASHGEAQASWRTVGPLPKDGSPETVGVAAYDPVNGVQTSGASFRMIVDVGDWDRSIAINTPGQSGDPRSAHYDDLYTHWISDRYVPLNYSPDAIERDAETRIELRPV